MFDFEKWSEEVFHLVDKIEEMNSRGEDVTLLKLELQGMWDEMMRQDDFAVQFLQQLLLKTRDLVDGKLAGSQFEEFVNQLRDKALR